MEITGIDFGNNTIDHTTMVILEISGNFKAPVPNDTKWKFVKQVKI